MTMRAAESGPVETAPVPSREAPLSLVRRYPQFTISPAILVALVACWWLATDVLGAPAYVVPAPEQVLRALINGLSRSPWDTGGYWYHTGVTVWEALLGLAIGSVLGAVVGEFVGASAGLGMLLMQYDQQMELAPMFAVILLLAVIGFLMNYVMGMLERRYCFWAQRVNASGRP